MHLVKLAALQSIWQPANGQAAVALLFSPEFFNLCFARAWTQASQAWLFCPSMKVIYCIERKKHVWHCVISGRYSLIWAFLVCAAPKGMVFQPVLVINFCNLVLNSLFFFFFRRRSYFFIMMFTATVRAATACHALRSRAGLQGILNWSWPDTINWRLFGQVINRVGKIADFGHK